mmetsp:Transcript_30376/g.97927  ORF Transcript_30376/g.97927 Transcript_30376/m.97927 type:complete len:250 (+) Transcript_30376:554-1303(+)
MEQGLQEVLGVGPDVPRIAQVTALDTFEELLAVPRIERGQPRQHLVEQRPKGPPVHGPAVPATREDLGREVLGGPAEGGRALSVVCDALLGEAKVGESDVAAGVEEDVLRLEVPVDDAEGVDVLEGEGELRGVEPRASFAELADLLEMAEEFAPGAVVEDEVELLPRLEGRVEADDEGVLHVAQDGALRFCVLDLVPLDDVFFFKDLHRVNRPRLTLAHEEHLPEAPLPDHADHLEVAHRRRLEMLLLL